MAVTVTDPAGAAQIPGVVGNKRMALVKVAFDSSYPTGGEILTPASLGMSRIDMVLTNGVSAAGRTVVPVLASGVWKLKAFTSAAAGTHTHAAGAITVTDGGHTHAAGDITMNAHDHDVVVTGDPETAVSESVVSTGSSAVSASGTTGITAAGAVSAAGGAIAAAAFSEVADTTDLSADSVLVLVFGI